MHGLILQAFSKKELKKLLQILTELKKPVKSRSIGSKREDELAGSRKEAKTIIENAKETAEQSKANILADAKLEAGHLKEKANQEIAQNKVEALQSVKGEVADLTISLAGKIISQNLDSHAHKALIDQYIDQLGEA